MSVIADLWSWPAENWSAVAAWVTATIALVAGIVAVRQLGEARTLRREQAQPYVAVFMDHSGVDPQFIDLVVRNFGDTAASDVVLKIEPPPQRAATSQQGYEAVWLPDSIPTLVPGQQWREMWDFTPDRAAGELPDRHEAEVTFKDSQGEAYRFSYVLDWSATRSRLYIKEYGLHDAAKTLRDISKTLKRSR